MYTGLLLPGGEQPPTVLGSTYYYFTYHGIFCQLISNIKSKNRKWKDRRWTQRVRWTVNASC